MDTPDVMEIAKAANQVGLVGLLVAIIVSGVKALWVPGFAYREKKAERDEAVAALDKFVGIHENQTRVMEDLQKEVAVLKNTLERLAERRGRP